VVVVVDIVVDSTLPATHATENIPAESKNTEPGYRTGKALTESLNQQSAWSVQGVAAQQLLHQISDDQRICILLDRRVDPNQLLSIDAPLSTRRQQLKRICDLLPDAEFCVMDHLICIAPQPAASRLPVLIDSHNDLLKPLRGKKSTAASDKLHRRATVRWEQLAEPRRVLQTAAENAGLVIVNPQEIPHDLWNSATLPAMTFAELAAVVLNQFDLTFERLPDANGNSPQIRIIPVDVSRRLERSYRFGMSHQKRAKELIAQQSPELSTTWSGGTLKSTTSISEHIQLQQLFSSVVFSDAASPVRNDIPLSMQKFSLKVAQNTTVGQLIAHLRKSGITIEIRDEQSEPVQQIMSRTVQLDVKQLPGNEFFHQAFGPHFPYISVQNDRVTLSLDE
jgi:hypothetical protein